MLPRAGVFPPMPARANSCWPPSQIMPAVPAAVANPTRTVKLHLDARVGQASLRAFFARGFRQSGARSALHVQKALHRRHSRKKFAQPHRRSFLRSLVEHSLALPWVLA